MYIHCFILDWEEAKRRLLAETLGEDIVAFADDDSHEAVDAEGDEAWIIDPVALELWPYDLLAQYDAIARVHRVMVSYLNMGNQLACASSVEQVIDEGLSHNDLEEFGPSLDIELFPACYSPDKVGVIANSFKMVDSVDYETAFREQGLIEDLPEFEDFDGEVLDYFAQWEDVFRLAADQGRGVMVMVTPE